MNVYGNNPEPAILYEDDGSWNPLFNEVTLKWASEGSLSRSGNGSGPRYEVAEWKFVE